MINIPPFIINETFASLEEFYFAAKRWNLNFHKLSSGSTQFSLKLIDIGIIQLSEVKIMGNFIQYGELPVNYRTIIIAGDEMQSFKWQNFDITSEYLLVAPKDNQFSAITNESFHVYTISIHESHFRKIIEDLNLSTLLTKFNNNEIVYPINKNFLILLISYINVLFKDLLKSNVDLTAKDKLSKLTKKLPEILLTHLNEHEAKFPLTKWRKSDEAALKFMEIYNTSSIPSLSIEEFCESTSTKQRTLEKAVKEYYGISPIALLKALRLNKFREELFRSFSSVVDSATKCGFSHLGQLSQDYKKLFGELPSQTMKNLSFQKN